jgi:hypothetical protein
MIKKRIKPRGRYKKSLKREIACRYLAGDFSYRVAAQEDQLDNGGGVKEFVKWYKRQMEYLPRNCTLTMANDTPKEEGTKELSLKELLERLAKAEQERDEARMVAEGWRTMIRVAEDELDIKIIKKSEAKPSGK